MPIIEKSLEELSKRAAECGDLAKAQRASADKQQESADKQHVAAHKSEELCESLTESVAALKKELAKPAEEKTVDQSKPAQASN